MYIVDTGASGSGSSSPELFNEVDFIPNQLAPRPSPASSPKPDSISNAIDEEDRELDPPGPVFVDDFYYDYNFINFHEDLSYGSFEEPHPDLVDTSHVRLTESPSDTPVPTAGAPGAEEEDSQGPWSLSPLLSEASHSPPVLEQSPVNPLANFLSEEDTPMGAPELGFPSLPWPPASADDTMTPDAPGNPVKLLVKEDKQSQPSTPRSERNKLSKDGNPLDHTSPALPQSPIPTQPSPPSISPTHASPSPDVVEVSTGWNVAWDPMPEADPKPAHVPTDPRSPGPLGQPQTPNPEGTQSPGLLPRPTLETQTNSSKHPEVQPLQPSLEEDGVPADLLPAKNASWQVGNWSQCSTTCGLGAIWRLVRCSSGNDEDCTLSSRPQPARHCHLRPCAAWRAGNWSKCSRNCGGGSSTRDVQCVDTRDLRPLRPFHCQPGPTKPPTHQLCGTQPCLPWYTSSWRECSEACGGGEQQRLVTCPEPGLCEESLKPNNSRPCNTHPCTQWVVGPWGQCSAPCGGGVQRRLVKCVNTQTGLAEEDSDLCSHEAWPESSRPCATEDCELLEPPRCERDRLSFNFCETLRLLGRCQLPTIRAQCCRSCPPLSHGVPSRGHQQVARR